MVIDAARCYHRRERMRLNAVDYGLVALEHAHHIRARLVPYKEASVVRAGTNELTKVIYNCFCFLTLSTYCYRINKIACQ